MTEIQLQSIVKEDRPYEFLLSKGPRVETFSMIFAKQFIKSVSFK